MKDRLITSSYCFILAANFLLYFGFWLLIPVLPFYLSEFFQAGNSTIGIVLSCYTVAALCIRPFSGYLLDTFARKPLYLFAYFIFMMMFGGYLIAGSLTLFIMFRIIHGVSFGMVTVGGNTVVIDIMPSSRRGEGLGYYGLTNNTAMSIGPMFGLFLHDAGVSFATIFCYAFGACILGFLSASLVKTPYKPPVKREPISLDRFILLKGIYQIGTLEESVPPETLFRIVNEFYEEFERRFGSHIHILDWALHLDEGTPHIHERHVFDCENRYGELCPQQEKALEELGIPLPNPEKPKGRNNNRKQTFDAVCRTILFDIARRHGLHLDQEPSYGGRDYLEKQDYILMKQKEQLAAQEQKLEELTLKIEDVETLLDDVSDAAYDKAVEVVTDTVRQETHKEDIRLVEESKKWVLSPERKAPKKEREYAAERLDGVITKIKNAMQHALAKIQRTLMQPEVKQAGKEQVKKKAKESIMDILAKAKINADRDNRCLLYTSRCV